MSLLKLKPFSIDTVDTFTFGNANVIGNLVSGNASLGNIATANFFQGNGSLLTSLTGANVSGQVANAALAGTVYTNAQPNITSVGTLTGITANGVIDFIGTSNVSLGNVANLKITGGSNGYFLQTDGSGRLSWAVTSSATGNANIAGSNTQVFFNDNGSGTLGTKSTFTFDKGTDVLTVSKISSNGALLTNIVGANVDGNVSLAVQSHFANIANSVAGTNVSGNVASAVQAHFANIANSVAGTNVSGNVASAVQAHFANIANSVSGTNVSGNVASAVQAHFANIANSVAGTNVSGNVASAVQAHFANIANSVAGTNVSGNVASAVQSHFANIANSVAGTNVSGNVASAVQAHFANIANSVAGTNVSGNVASAVQSHFANIANSVAGTNVSGNVSSANVAYYESVTTQTTGTFYPVFVNNSANGNYALASNSALSFDAATGVLTTGTIQSGGSGGNITGANLISANFFQGSGSLLTSITGANVSGNVSFAVQSHYANIANSIAGANVSGNVTSAVQSHYANIANSVAGANVSGNVASAVQAHFANIANAVTFANVSGTPTTISGYGITDAYSNTNAGAYLTTYTGDLAGANLTLTGNLIISGTTTSVNSTVTRVVDPIFELGGGANGAALTNDDGKDRGTLLHYYAGVAVKDAFMGWDNSNAEFGFGSAVTVSSDVVTFTTYGNLRANYFLGNGSQLTGVSATTSSKLANGTSNVDINGSGGNVTVGVGGTSNVVTITTTGVNVAGYINTGTGNITSGNASLGNLATANYFSGNGSTLSALTFGNIATFSTAGLTTDELYLQSTTRLNVTASGVSGYVFDQYGATVNPTIYVTSGQTLAFNLNVTGHPFLIQTGAGSNYNIGLEHVDTTGTVLTTTSAQGKVAGTLYWKVPYGIAGSYKYQCSVHGGMNGTIVVTDANVANITVGFATTANAVAGGNVSGNVGFAIQAHYANIANSVAGANVSGNVAFAAVANNVAGGNVSGQVGNALIAGTVYTNAQPNITSVGTLANLTVSGATNLGAVGNVTITGGSADYFLKTNGSGVLSFASVPTTSLNVDTYTGDGSFTMKTLTVTPASIAYTLLAIGGVFQPRSAYSLSGAVITFSDPPPNGAIVEVTTIVAGAAGAGAGGGGSGNTTNALTIGTGLSGTSFNGSAAVTVAIDSTVARLAGSQTLTNKTLSSAILTGTLTAGGSVGTNGQVLTSTVTGVQWSAAAAGASWVYSAISANTSAVAGYRYIVDTATANLTITLPASGTLGDEIMIIDGTGNASTHAITVDKNGGKIQGLASNMIVTTNRAAFTLVYYNSTQGWLLTNV